MAAVAAPAVATAQRILLSNISWDTYERLLADDPDRAVPRLTYDRGALEIVSPSPEHEEDADALRLVVVLATAARAIPIKRLGSTTFRRPDLRQGFEPDGSFYIQREAQVRGRRRIDLSADPPPDLVIEMDVSRSSLDKLPLFAGMGIPEVWRCDGDKVAIFALIAGTFREVPASVALPFLTSAVLTRFLLDSRTLLSSEWVAMVSDWARAQHPPDVRS